MKTLNQWRKDNRYTLPAFAKLLREKGEVKVTTRTIHNWEIGFCEPSLVKADAVKRVTGGEVLPESFIQVQA